MLTNSLVKDNLGLIESSILHFNVSKKKYNNNNIYILVMDKSSSLPQGFLKKKRKKVHSLRDIRIKGNFLKGF